MMTSERRHKIVELLNYHAGVFDWKLAKMTDGDLIDCLIEEYQKALDKIGTLEAEVKELSDIYNEQCKDIDELTAELDKLKKKAAVTRTED